MVGTTVHVQRGGKQVTDLYSCKIEIIKGLTDKGQFEYVTVLKGPQEGAYMYLYITQFLSKINTNNISECTKTLYGTA